MLTPQNAFSKRSHVTCNANATFMYREDICLQTLLLLFKYANRKNKGSFVSTANEALVGTLMTIGDVKSRDRESQLIFSFTSWRNVKN